MSGQVQLSNLIFTHNWEDPAVDEAAFALTAGANIFTITSGGCNTLGLLRFNPKAIYCVDINPAQTWLMELKQAAFRGLSHAELLSFLGVREENRRIDMYDGIKNYLSIDARNFWDGQTKRIRRGLIMNGRYERFARIAGALIRFLEGKEKTRKFFETWTLEEQAAFYRNRWDHFGWRMIFKIMFNKKRLAKKGLKADYFHFDDGSASFSESFYRRASHAMTSIPASTNYFLALYLLGHYLNEDALPAYLQEKNFVSIRQEISRIHPVTADSKLWLKKQPADFFDAMGLSNICELMDDQDTFMLFNEVQRTAKRGARIVFRNLMVPREVPVSLRHSIVEDEARSRELRLADRSFVYSKVAVYDVLK